MYEHFLMLASQLGEQARVNSMDGQGKYTLSVRNKQISGYRWTGHLATFDLSPESVLLN